MNKVILLVEDDEILLGMYQTKLANAGYTILTAKDGETGLKTALTEKPDIILLDIKMPKMDGMTLLKKLREDDWGKAVPVIMLTNLDATGQILQRIVTDHPAYYIIKANTTPVQLLEKVNEVLANPSKTTGA